MGNIGKKLGYIVAPLLTPFYRDSGEVNYDMAKQLTEHLISDNLCDSIIVGGSTGEFSTMSYEERVKMLHTVKEACANRIPLVAGTGAPSTREAIALTQEAEKMGYDAVLVVGPYYCNPTQEGIYEHFKAIAESTNLPILLYNIPIFTNLNIKPETVGRLSKIPNIVGIKDEAGLNPTQMTEYRLATYPEFVIYNGDDIMILCGLAQGAAGVVSGGAHVIGHIIRKMINAFVDGRIEEAKKIHYEIYPFFKGVCQNGRINPQPILKEAVALCGYDLGYARQPLDHETPEEIEYIRQQLLRLGVLE